MAVVNVSIGPVIDLHVGIHGSLLANPPESVNLRRRRAAHWFLFPEEGNAQSGLSPFEAPHYGEFVRFSTSDVVHTARWPALHCSSWVTDLDDFGYPILAGRYAFNREFRKAFREAAPDAAYDLVRSRAQCMLSAYGHPSCKAILFRTRHALKIARDWISELGLAHVGQEFLKKAEVVYPSRPPIQLDTLESKWRDAKSLRVLFCGRDFIAKNGQLALDIFARLAARHPRHEFTYIGSVPDTVRLQMLHSPSNLQVLPEVAHEEVLSCMTQSHILFHPAHIESFGMVLLEAAAAGLVIVCADGAGMSHVQEFLEPSGVARVEVDHQSTIRERQGFEEALDNLLSDVPLAKRMALDNFESATTGSTSLAKRNRRLQELYEIAHASRGADVLSFDELSVGKKYRPVEMSEGGVLSTLQKHIADTALYSKNIYF